MLYQSEILRELHSFAAFCREKPADERYEFVDSQACACAQYLQAKGVFCFNWCYREQIDKYPGMRRLNNLAQLACMPFTGMVGRWGYLLKLVEQEIDRELHKQERL